MIFLLVKVNCPQYVFNISKYIRILKNIKKLGNFRKSARKCAPDDSFTFASDDVILGKQTKEQAIEVLSDTLHNTQAERRRNGFLKHKLAKLTSYLISMTHNNANKTIKLKRIQV